MFPATGRPCICDDCGRRYHYNHRRGHTKRRCNSCRSAAYTKALKLELIRMKAGGCEICGYDRCIQALVFHHIDPTTKRFNVAGSYNRGLKMIRAEAAKCVLLCENCHREVERGITQIPEEARTRVEAHIATVDRYPPRRAGRPAVDDW